MIIPIPDSHLDLITEPVHAVLTTMMPDGQPQSSLVWCDYDGICVRINATRERQKGKNMQANPKVTLLIIDVEDASRWIEIRGEAKLAEEGALEHLDEITQQYTNYPKYYGYFYPKDQKERETRIICRIIPSKINRDAIHA